MGIRQALAIGTLWSPNKRNTRENNMIFVYNKTKMCAYFKQNHRSGKTHETFSMKRMKNDKGNRTRSQCANTTNGENLYKIFSYYSSSCSVRCCCA